LTLQAAQRQTVIPTELVPAQSARFEFKHQPLDLFTASSLSPWLGWNARLTVLLNKESSSTLACPQWEY
jgi:hypothetical protein